MPQHQNINLNRKLLGEKPEFFRKLFTSIVPLFLLTFLCTLLISSIFTPVETSNAETVVTADILGGDGYYITLTSSTLVTMDLNTSPSGAMTVVSDNIKVKTNSPSGYALYLGMTGDSSNTNELIHTTDSTKTIKTTGTLSNPIALSNGYWGYAFPKNTDSVVENNFNTAYRTMSSDTVDDSLLFAAVPIKGSEVLIQKTNSANTSAEKIIPIYFGVRANLGAVSGSYTNKLAYTAVAEASSNAAGDIYLDKDYTTNLEGGDSLTITTSLYSNAENIDYTVTLDGNALSCARDTSIAQFRVNCPSLPKKAMGTYSIVVSIPYYGKSYTKDFSYTPSFYLISTMQEMTESVCNSVYTPSTVTGNDVTIINQASALAGGYTASGNGYSSQVPETTLTDTRDNNTYKVRKLADGNCWMVQNLALEFGEGERQVKTLTPSDSDVTTNTTINVATQTESSATTAALWNAKGILTSETAETEARTIIEQWLSRKSNYTWTYNGESQDAGVYYNWYTATAGNGGYDATDNVKIAGSICPAGWRLPDPIWEGDTYYTLIHNVYGLASSNRISGNEGLALLEKLHGLPFSLGLTGYITADGNTAAQGYTAQIHTAGANSNLSSRYFVMTTRQSDNVVLTENYFKSYGKSVRCISK